MNYEPERAVPTVAFSLRLEQELYERLHRHSFETGSSKNRIVGKALESFLAKCADGNPADDIASTITSAKQNTA